MSKFKVGDRVMVIKDNGEYLKAGEEGTVTETEYSSIQMQSESPNKFKRGRWWIADDSVELIGAKPKPTFKVGARVKMIGPPFADSCINKFGTITEDDGTWQIITEEEHGYLQSTHDYAGLEFTNGEKVALEVPVDDSLVLFPENQPVAKTCNCAENAKASTELAFKNLEMRMLMKKIKENIETGDAPIASTLLAMIGELSFSLEVK